MLFSYKTLQNPKSKPTGTENTENTSYEVPELPSVKPPLILWLPEVTLCHHRCMSHFPYLLFVSEMHRVISQQQWTRTHKSCLHRNLFTGHYAPLVIDWRLQVIRLIWYIKTSLEFHTRVKTNDRLHYPKSSFQCSKDTIITFWVLKWWFCNQTITEHLIWFTKCIMCKMYYPRLGRALDQAFVFCFFITQNNDCFPARKRASLSSLHCLCVTLWCYTWAVLSLTTLPKTQDESKNIYFYWGKWQKW